VLRFFSSAPALTSEGPGHLDRREWLRIGGFGGLGLFLAAPASPAAARKAAPGFGKARSVLLVYASGGQSQLDTWDPKPEAPEEVRGIFRPIATSVPGIRLCEHMPNLARLAHHYTIVRTVSHDDLDHGSAAYLALTGQFHPQKSSNPLPAPTDAPTYGAILQRVRPARELPYSAIHLNGPALVPELPAPGQAGGWLGRAYDPLLLDDVTEDDLALHGLDPLPELPPVRLRERRSLLASLDHYRRRLAGRPMREMGTLYHQAYDLLAASRYRHAFDLSGEPAAVRDRYGRHRPGQACLLARRLIEAGLPLVTVIWSHSIRGQDRDPARTELYGWDTHNDIFVALKQHLLPHFDQTFAVLLEDLHARGLLEQTLVVCMGEFGRAPLVARERTFAGSSPGRKHWAAAYSIVVAGAGVAGGAVYGKTDRRGAYPDSAPVRPGDIAATIFSALGIDPAGHYTDAAGRPFSITAGEPIRGIYG
jgi:hypothetical protein